MEHFETFWFISRNSLIDKITHQFSERVCSAAKSFVVGFSGYSCPQKDKYCAEIA